jgi:acyl carrier protein
MKILETTFEEGILDKQAFLRSFEQMIEAAQGSLNEESVLMDTEGWNSMAFLGFIAMADEEFGLNPDPKAIRACVTIQDLMRLVGIHQ